MGISASVLPLPMLVPLPVFDPIKINNPVAIVEKKPEAPKPITYTVIEGDTLTSISDAQRVPLSRLWAANTQLADPNTITPGMVLNVPQNTDVLADRPMPVIVEVSASDGVLS